MKKNVLPEKTFAFAIRVVRAYKYLVGEKKEFVLLKQFLRSETSIGANAEESVGGQSKADLISKINIAYGEATETRYWIKLLQATNHLDEPPAKSLLNDLEEILKIIGAIQIIAKNQLVILSLKH